MNSDQPSLLGALVRWSRGSNVLVGLVVDHDQSAGSVLLFTDAINDLTFRLPAAECVAVSPTSLAVREPTTHDDPYLRGLQDARAAVAGVAAELAMSDDVVRCSGASRAYEAVEGLIVALDA